MQCRISNSKPEPNDLRLFRNSGSIEKRAIEWISLDTSYVIRVPPKIFFGRTKPEDCLIRITPESSETDLLKPNAKLDSYVYEIFPPAAQGVTDTPPEIIVNDEGPLDKPRKEAAGRKSAR